MAWRSGRHVFVLVDLNHTVVANVEPVLHHEPVFHRRSKTKKTIIKTENRPPADKMPDGFPRTAGQPFLFKQCPPLLVIRHYTLDHKTHATTAVSGLVGSEI